MLIETCIGITFLLFLAASSVIGVMGWIRTDMKLDHNKLVLKAKDEEIAELRRMLSKERAKVGFLKSIKEN